MRKAGEGNTMVSLGGDRGRKNPEGFHRLLIRRLRETIEELYAHRVMAGTAEDQGFPFAATLECLLLS
jgi:hypothetical protein